MGGPLLTRNLDFTVSTMKSPSDVLSRQALVPLLCLTLCDPMDCSPSGSYVHGILQTRILELPFPSPGDTPASGIKPGSPALQADSLPSEPSGKPKQARE